MGRRKKRTFEEKPIYGEGKPIGGDEEEKPMGRRKKHLFFTLLYLSLFSMSSLWAISTTR
jgi:hypothetical protein